MKKHLLKPVTTWGIKPQLQTMDPKVLPAAWIVLRWYVLRSLRRPLLTDILGVLARALHTWKNSPIPQTWCKVLVRV